MSFIHPLRLSNLGRTFSNTCANASACVHWAWVFLAWVVLADVGQRTAQGVGTMLPLVVWWVWLVARPLPAQRLPSKWRLALFPVLAVMGLGVAYEEGSSLAAWVAAAAWAQSCIQSQQISRAIGSRRVGLVWASPVCAAVLAWALLMLWPQHRLLALGLLLPGAVVLLVATWHLQGTVVSCPVLSRRLAQGWRSPGLAGASAQAAQLAMGLMMGSLALSGQWCTQAGWPASATLALHLLLMALAAGLAQALCAVDQTGQSAASAQPWTRLRQHLPWARATCLVAGGVALLIWSGPQGLLVCMVCHCLAWGLSLSGQTSAPSYGAAERWTWAVLSGASLAWIAWGAASLGPWVLVWAHAAVSIVGLLALLSLVWRVQGRTPGVSSAMP